MDLTQLEMFNAVAEAGSITQAAAKVHRVPSNLTTRLRQLETELGVDLFIRENQRLRLSPAGHNFLRYSQQILTFHADGAAPGTIHEMESYHGMLACVVAGAGIALIPRSMLESMPGHHQVEAWPLAEQWRWLTTWLVWRRGAKTRPLEAFIQLLDAPDSAKQGYQ